MAGRLLHIRILLPVLFLVQGIVCAQTPKDTLQSSQTPEKIEELSRLANKYMESSLEKSLNFANQAMEIAEKIQDSISMANCYRQIGTIYSRVQMYEEASNYYDKDLSLRLDLQDLEQIEESYYLLGKMYSESGEFEDASDLMNSAFQISVARKDTQGIGLRHYNLGEIYLQLNNMDSASSHFDTSLVIFQTNFDSVGQIQSLVALGQIKQVQNDYKGSREFFSQALRLAARKGLDYEMAFIAYHVALSLQESQLAIDHLIRALDLCEENDFHDLLALVNNRLADISVYNKNYSEALNYRKTAFAYEDSLRLTDLQNKANFLEMKYDYDLNQKELDLLRIDNEINEINLLRQKRIRQFSISIILIFFIAIAISIRIFMLRRGLVKSMEEKRIQLEKANRDLLLSEKNLKNLNDTKNKLFSILAHDLINPFNALLGFASLLYEGSQSLKKEEIKQYSNVIYQTAKNLFILLENLLQWSRSQTGKIVLQRELIDLNKLVSNILAIVQVLADKKKIKISSTFDLNKSIHIDPNLVGAALRNLVMNAIKFTPEGKSIHISTGVSNNRCYIKVEDTGTGISDEDQKKLFRTDMHFTTKGTSDEQGTGLGLIIAKEFVELNDGELKLVSKLGKGSTFTIELPDNS